jgi:hypothetical protein
MIAPNIFQFSGQNLLAWTAAYALWEPISYFIFPALFKAATTQEYYNPKKFNFATVAFGDYIYSTMLWIVAVVLTSSIFGTSAPANWLEWAKRLAVFIGVQWTGDLTFYMFITQIKKIYTNKYIDFFARYGKQVGIGAPIGDSLYGITWFLTTQFVASNFANWMQALAIATFAFATFMFSFQ